MATSLLFGSGELGKEFVIACQLYGQGVIAVDHYEGAPAMQVAHAWEVMDMLDAKALDSVLAKYAPNFIVSEIEAIRTERFYAYEEQGITVVPGAIVANFTMNRKAIRDLAYKELGLKTANYRYATNLEDFKSLAVDFCGFPCVVKPLVSSSGKGQSVIKKAEDINRAWNYAMEGSRGDLKEVIVESFVDFDFEITLLTVTQKKGPTLFCPLIGHRQERGDYQESWQPIPMQESHWKVACSMADKVTKALTGNGLWDVEFFITQEGPYFSELSPRPHDTGMVTLGNTQTFNEFELHAGAILGWPIPAVERLKNVSSAVIFADREEDQPKFQSFEKASCIKGTDFRIFGKPFARPYRRIGGSSVFRTRIDSVTH
jgi:phosphoribosylglycinamide formyltransferase 2